VIAREFNLTQQGCCPSQLVERLAAISPGRLHRGQPIAVSVTQATDLGGVYAIDEIRTNCRGSEAARPHAPHGRVRFANAVAWFGCSPAEPTWRSRIDIMSFGATKDDGALCDAIIVSLLDLARVSPSSPRGAARCLVPRLAGTAHYQVRTLERPGAVLK
jgi:threonine aldolase